jgi:hypothetical protein
MSPNYCLQNLFALLSKLTEEQLFFCQWKPENAALFPDRAASPKSKAEGTINSSGREVASAKANVYRFYLSMFKC